MAVKPGAVPMSPKVRFNPTAVAIIVSLVIGMIESPAAVAQAAAILAVPGLDGTMIGTADLGASRRIDDPDVPTLVGSVHGALADSSALRMDIVPGLEQAEAAFADGANLVVYNLAHSIMRHLRQLSSARRAVDHATVSS